MNKISIIVPVWNEEGNIEALVQRIHSSLTPKFTYEIIFIDDRSTDGSLAVMQRLARNFPLVIRTKRGDRGKAQSILEGMSYARYRLVAMIDADLQYPPEAIAKMAKHVVKSGFETVISNRQENHTPIHRKIMHDTCRILLGKVLHNLDVDIQSGLKVFRKEIINIIPSTISPWAFDLEFLVHARNAGYTIGSCDIVFDKRHSGEAKINLVEGTWQITISALRLKFKRFPRIAYEFMISIVLPVRNESENLGVLVSSIDHVMTRAGHKFEIISIDDYSTDDSYEVMFRLAKTFPIRAYRKQGIIGKGAALVEGIEKSLGDIVVLLDADRVYPPEAIPLLISQLKDADIVVADRIRTGDTEHRIKRLLGGMAGSFFGKTLFGLDYDVQSGLKVFKKKIMKHVSVEPSQWSFDMEFLLKARHAGYVIKGVPVKTISRRRGNDKMHYFPAGIELLVMALKFKMWPLDPVAISPEHIHTEVVYNKKRYKGYTNLSHRNSAIQTINSKQVYVMLGMALALLIFFLFNWMNAIIFVISFLTLLYFTDLIFNLFLILSSLRKNPEISVTAQEIREVKEWPMYTIICPLFKEWEVLPQFISAIAKLDYPKEKLQVIISLEEVDKKTIDEIGKMKLPSYFDVLITPDTQPRTKPKACNYALLHTKGEYVVIYDAEDIPDRMQLKKAIAAFRRLEGQNVVCLQAKLNFYNPNQNLLTRLFSLEYSLWFDLVLTGLHSINAPIPLGGTSNHFKKKYLDLLQGWDPFNVTEDCDLGIRLFKNGYHTKVLDSVTMEEANSSFFGWFPQRSRWIKGYIQTYLVHMRRPHEFISGWQNPHILTFQIIVGFKILSMWINPFLWLLTITYFALRPVAGPFIESLYLTPILYLGVVSLIAGNFLYFYYYMIGAAKRQQWDLIKYAFFVPLYWLMMSYASLLALRQIIFAPHYWEKTKHGLHLKKAPITA